MIKSISRFFTGIVNRFLPEPLVFAVLLTVIVFIAAIGLTPSNAVQIVGFWGKGFWNLLAFAMQMSMVLVTGHALASSHLVKNWLASASSIAKTPRQGVFLVALASSIACFINWGFGLIIGAIFAREIAKKIPKADYRLLIASAYMGFLTWHGGLSASIPLVAATKGNPMESICGIIPISATLLTPYNIFISLSLIAGLPFLAMMMCPKEDEVVAVDPKLLHDEHIAHARMPKNPTPAERLEHSIWPCIIIAVLGGAYLIGYFAANGADININTINMIFLLLGLLLHKSLINYSRAVTAAVRGTAGIMVQFPLYAGIQMMMEQSGLGGIITNWFVNVSTAATFPVLAFFSSGLINFAVPSGGGHWVVQGPFIMPAAKILGANPGKAAMAIAYGEAWANMAQPFWALPALAIAKLGVRDIMGYCVTALLFSGVIFVVGLAFL